MRQLALAEGFHAVILQTYGIEHAAGCFRNAGAGIAFAGLQREPLDDNAAELGQIAVGRKFRTVTEGAGRCHDGILEAQGMVRPGKHNRQIHRRVHDVS